MFVCRQWNYMKLSLSFGICFMLNLCPRSGRTVTQRRGQKNGQCLNLGKSWSSFEKIPAICLLLGINEAFERIEGTNLLITAQTLRASAWPQILVQCRICTQCHVLCSNEKINYQQHILQCQESSDSVLLCPSKDFWAYKKFFPLLPPAHNDWLRDCWKCRRV